MMPSRPAALNSAPFLKPLPGVLRNAAGTKTRWPEPFSEKSERGKSASDGDTGGGCTICVRGTLGAIGGNTGAEPDSEPMSEPGCDGGATFITTPGLTPAVVERE